MTNAHLSGASLIRWHFPVVLARLSRKTLFVSTYFEIPSRQRGSQFSPLKHTRLRRSTAALVDIARKGKNNNRCYKKERKEEWSRRELAPSPVEQATEGLACHGRRIDIHGWRPSSSKLSEIKARHDKSICRLCASVSGKKSRQDLQLFAQQLPWKVGRS